MQAARKRKPPVLNNLLITQGTWHLKTIVRILLEAGSEGILGILEEIEIFLLVNIYIDLRPYDRRRPCSH